MNRTYDNLTQAVRQDFFQAIRLASEKPMRYNGVHKLHRKEVNEMPYAKLPKDFPEPPKLPERYFEDDQWMRAHLSELTQKYPDHWIAVLEKEVVIASKDLEEVERVALQRAAEVGKGQCVYKFIESLQRLRGAVGVRYPGRP